ncbi:hypothetical protein AF332_24390 [Sporosarcina globispora]|uniref:Uncharacterized protein n=1 Tax=Sporosarcina globispora TaxID=1459 RepID=A0A0M0GIH3_SPOGL|nr:hypothetical protein AF332_24390 [Sporosarcina globispora]
MFHGPENKWDTKKIDRKTYSNKMRFFGLFLLLIFTPLTPCMDPRGYLKHQHADQSCNQDIDSGKYLKPPVANPAIITENSPLADNDNPAFRASCLDRPYQCPPKYPAREAFTA